MFFFAGSDFYPFRPGTGLLSTIYYLQSSIYNIRGYLSKRVLIEPREESTEEAS